MVPLQPLVRWFTGALIGSLVLASSQSAWAQSLIVPDDSLGTEGSQVINNFAGQPVELIQGGAVRGANLFHSFREFNVSTGRGAYFDNSVGAENIISRVTGINSSNIQGILGVLGSGNLFLINPNGIIFGPGASLDVNGSFVATTASALQFGNQGLFSATNPEPPSALLTIRPSAFLFNQIVPGNIVNRSSVPLGESLSGPLFGLQVSDGRSLLMIGGNVELDGGGLNALGGSIQLGGLAEPGVVNLGFAGNRIQFNLPPDRLRANVILNNNARVYVIGTGGGDVLVDANQLVLTNNGRIVAGSEGDGNAGNIVVDAQAFLATEGGRLVNQILDRGNGGNIEITADSIAIAGIGTTIPSGIYSIAAPGSTGNLGSIKISSGSVTLTGSGIPGGDALLEEPGIFSRTFPGAFGKAGDIRVNTNLLNIQSSAVLSLLAEGLGGSGNVSVSGDQINLSQLGSIESSGNLIINTRQFRAIDGGGAGVIAFADNNAGTFILNASESIDLKGVFQLNGSSTFGSSFLIASAVGSGSFGDLRINTNNLRLADGATINTGTLAGGGNGGNLFINSVTSVILDNSSSIAALAGDLGNVGNIVIATAKLLVQQGSSTIALANGTGKIGDISIRTDQVIVAGESDNSLFPSRISVSNSGSGNAGTIRIHTNELIAKDGGQITASASGSGNAGSIDISASEIQLLGTNRSSTGSSGLNTQTFGAGDGGKITVNTERLIIRDGATIASGTALVSLEKTVLPSNNSLVRGRGGDIQIKAREFVELTGTNSRFSLFNVSSITSDVGLGVGGVGGSVSIEAGRLLVQGGARVSAATFGEGDAGSVNIRASKVELADPSAGLFPAGIAASSVSDGRGGSVAIEANRLIVRDGAEVTVSSAGNGSAGNLSINSDWVYLNNQGQITAAAKLSEGGNIRLNAKDLLLLRRNSLISAQSGDRGRDGNIQINAGFIVAVPSENSDIIARSANAGNIDLTANGIFGFTIQKGLTLTPKSEITATGFVTLNTPNVDPTQGLIELPTNVVDPANQIVQGCPGISGRDRENVSRFVVTGRGALPPNPTETLTGEPPAVEWYTPETSTSGDARVPEQGAIAASPPESPLVEATHWVVQPDGEIYLVAAQPIAYPFSNPRRCLP